MTNIRQNLFWAFAYKRRRRADRRGHPLSLDRLAVVADAGRGGNEFLVGDGDHNALRLRQQVL